MGDSNGMDHRSTSIGMGFAATMLIVLCLLHLVGFVGLPGGYRFSSLLWELTASVLALSAVFAWLLSKHSSSGAAHIAAFWGALVGGVMISLLNGARLGTLVCAAVSLVASGVIGRAYCPGRLGQRLGGDRRVF